LYFFIPIHSVGPLLLSMLWMYVDVVYFISLLGVMILGFAAAFNLLYGGIDASFTGFGISIFTCITVAYNQQYFVNNDEFVPLPVYWAGDITMVIYLVLSAILLVNLLIAMMQSTYNELMTQGRPIEGEWSVAFGKVLLHYERFLFFPPPFNILQIFAFCLGALFCCKHYRWILFGSQETRDRIIRRLLRQKLNDLKRYSKKRKKRSCCNKQDEDDDQNNEEMKTLIDNSGVDEVEGNQQQGKLKEKIKEEIERDLHDKEEAIWAYTRDVVRQYDVKQKVQKIRLVLWRLHKKILSLQKKENNLPKDKIDDEARERDDEVQLDSEKGESIAGSDSEKQELLPTFFKSKPKTKSRLSQTSKAIPTGKSKSKLSGSGSGSASGSGSGSEDKGKEKETSVSVKPIPIAARSSAISKKSSKKLSKKDSGSGFNSSADASFSGSEK